MHTESLDYYWKLAKKLIMVHGYVGLLKDDENIGFVANALMNADLSFDPKIGILEGYRSMHARFAILKLIKKQKNKVKSQGLSIQKHDGSYLNKGEQVVECEEALEFIRKENLVSDSVLEQIKDRFMHSCSWAEVAKRHSITKQQAKLNVKHGLFKIRKRLCK